MSSPSAAPASLTTPPHHRLRQVSSGALLPAGPADRGGPPTPPSDASSLWRAEYAEASFVVEPTQPGLFRYRRWLPSPRVLSGAPSPVAWRSAPLAAELGLRELWIAFSGHAPERGARFATGTFKELAAYAVLAAWPKGERRIMTLASAGSTARAMLHVASAHGQPVVVVVPARALPTLAQVAPPRPNARVVALGGDATYGDARAVARALAEQPGFFAEGGVRNVARRDGLGTALLAVAERFGRLPDCYVQAVGSATGAIGAFEAAQRLRRAGVEGGPMRLHLVQNEAFCPLHRAWREGARTLEPRDPTGPLHAAVLSNPSPPWAIAGGVRDVLAASGGQTWTATAAEAREASERFLAIEGIDLHPAAAVGLAGLVRAVRAGAIGPREIVLFHATGGGRRAQRALGPLHPVEPDAVVEPPLPDPRLAARHLAHVLLENA